MRLGQPGFLPSSPTLTHVVASSLRVLGEDKPGLSPNAGYSASTAVAGYRLMNKQASHPSIYPHPPLLDSVWGTCLPSFPAPATWNLFQSQSSSGSLTYWLRSCLCLYLEQSFPLIAWLKPIHASGLSANVTSSGETSLTTSLPAWVCLCSAGNQDFLCNRGLLPWIHNYLMFL